MQIRLKFNAQFSWEKVLIGQKEEFITNENLDFNKLIVGPNYHVYWLIILVLSLNMGYQKFP